MTKAEVAKRRREEIKAYIENYKKGKQCVRCENSDYRVLEFHHRDPKEKKFSIFKAIHNRYSIPSVSREIEKCDVVCANCHRIIHWEWEQERTNNGGNEHAIKEWKEPESDLC